MKTVIMYHRADLDGQCSGAIAKMKYPQGVLYGIDYGDSVPWEDLRGSRVVMVDFSLQPWEEMQKLSGMAAEVVWIDHHRSAIDLFFSRGAELDLERGWETVLAEEYAACELAYGHWFAGELPLPVTLLGRYDVWDLSAYDNILEFQMGMHMEDWNPETQMDKWEELLGSDLHKFEEVVNRGRIILEYQREKDRKLMGRAFELMWQGEVFLAVNAGGINAGGINSLAFESKYDPEKHFAVMAFSFTGDKWTVSLYSPDQRNELVDFAKRMGGGGHPYACGFQLEDIDDLGVTDV